MSEPRIRCHWCCGIGESLVFRVYAPHEGPQYWRCKVCNGRGWYAVSDMECSTCYEPGRILHEKTDGRPLAFCSDRCLHDWLHGNEEAQGVAS